MKWISALLLALFAAVSPAFADGLIIVDPGHWHPIPPRPEQWPPPVRTFAPLEIAYHHVKVRIDGPLATTTVDQEFRNPNPETLEGTYIFPIPKGASIDHFTMEIGGHPVEAELLPADKARAIFEEIVRKAKDPALLEYAGRDVFKVRVYPIEGHGTKRISLSYSQVLTADNGLVGYTYPLNTEKFSAAPIHNVRIQVDLISQDPIHSIYSPTHTIDIKRDGPRHATASYEVSDARPDTDFTLYFAPEKRDLGLHLLTTRPPGEDGYFLLLASPGDDLRDEQVLPKDIVFVIDTSGSMSGHKLDQAKRALQFCIENLNEHDRFEIIRFSTDVNALFDGVVDASRDNRARALEYVKRLNPTGGTAIDDALQRALSARATKSDTNRPLAIVFLTDGQPTVGLRNEDGIVTHAGDSNKNRARVFCFGIGTDVNTHLLDRIAETTRGSCQYVLPEEDLEVKVSSFFAKINQPVLANPSLAIRGGVHVESLYPAPLPDLFRGEQLLVVGRYTGRGDATLEIEGSVNGEHKSFTRKVRFSDSEPDNAAFLPRLWATRRIGYLLDDIRLHGENTELRDEVTRLARQYGIVTPYTAYLIAEDEKAMPLARQSLPLLNSDRRLNEAASANWNSFKDERTGNQALAGARSGFALKSASAPAVALQDSLTEASQGFTMAGAPPAPSALGAEPQPAQPSQQNRFVQGRNFFQNSNQWIDGSIAQLKNSQRIRVQFGSPEYFALARREPQAAPWLALGQNVQFAIANTVYEIYE